MVERDPSRPEIVSRVVSDIDFLTSCRKCSCSWISEKLNYEYCMRGITCNRRIMEDTLSCTSKKNEMLNGIYGISVTFVNWPTLTLMARYFSSVLKTNWQMISLTSKNWGNFSCTVPQTENNFERKLHWWIHTYTYIEENDELFSIISTIKSDILIHEG